MFTSKQLIEALSNAGPEAYVRLNSDGTVTLDGHFDMDVLNYYFTAFNNFDRSRHPASS